MRTGPLPSLMLVLSLLAILPRDVAARQQETPDEFTKRITEELRQRNARAAELFAQANVARDSGDLATAEWFYRQVRDLEPGFDHAVRRLCGVVSEGGRRDGALSLCREAFQLDSSLVNRAALTQTLLTSSATGPSRDELWEALFHGQILLDHPEVDEFGLSVACLAAAANGAVEMLQSCSERLDGVSDDPGLKYYVAWMLEMVAEDYDGAELLLQEARREGMPAGMYEQLLQSTRDARPVLPGILRRAGIVGGIWLGGLVLLLGAGAVLSQLTLRAARRLPTVASGESGGGDAALRRIYRAVLWLCCAYYYVSIPLVLVAVVGLGGAIVYGFLAAGRIPIRLLIIVVIVVVVTLYAALKSIFVRARDVDPGERLDTSDHPRLRKVLDEVAGEIGTRPVDNVYVTPGTELAVMERGGMLRQLRGASERCLILGVGVLNDMKLGPFKAILGHEYGHFSNRDTAGGGFALAVRRSLLRMAEGLVQGGAAAWYNPAWLFLNGFHRIFLRISQGASRLQEVLADRWAAFAYGARQFERGLRHVIERTVRFNVHANATLKDVIEQGHALTNFYGYHPEGLPGEDEILEAVESAIHAEPSPYDSHPSPHLRFEWVQAIASAPTGDLSDADVDVWELFTSRDDLELSMTSVIRKNVKENYGVVIAGAG